MSLHVLMIYFLRVTWEKKLRAISLVCSMRSYKVTPVPSMISTKLLPIFHQTSPYSEKTFQKPIYFSPLLCYHFINQYMANMRDMSFPKGSQRGSAGGCKRSNP